MSEHTFKLLGNDGIWRILNQWFSINNLVDSCGSLATFTNFFHRWSQLTQIEASH
jgi:hypothetical protein